MKCELGINAFNLQSLQISFILPRNLSIAFIISSLDILIPSLIKNALIKYFGFIGLYKEKPFIPKNSKNHLGVAYYFLNNFANSIL
jgi:hypothetical protein